MANVIVLISAFAMMMKPVNSEVCSTPKYGTYPINQTRNAAELIHPGRNTTIISPRTACRNERMMRDIIISITYFFSFQDVSHEAKFREQFVRFYSETALTKIKNGISLKIER